MNQLSKHPHLKWYVSNLRAIPSGSYHYGASPSDKQRGTKITMSPFSMGATPVTWGMWKEYRSSIAVPGKGIKLPKDPGWGYPDDHPVVNVSWEDIMAPSGFCEWASGVAGFKLTLPTDAQWEYAARGGKDGLDFPWGNRFEQDKLWCSLKELSDVLKAAPVDRVTRIHRNGYGLTDMIGNVSQWCLDFMDLDYNPQGRDPRNNRRTDSRFIRGYCWTATEKYKFLFLISHRDGLWPDTPLDNIGFRLVAPPK